MGRLKLVPSVRWVRDGRIEGKMVILPERCVTEEGRDTLESREPFATRLWREGAGGREKRGRFSPTARWRRGSRSLYKGFQVGEKGVRQ